MLRQLFLFFAWMFAFSINAQSFSSKPIAELSKTDLKGFRISEDKFENRTFVELKNWGFDDRLTAYISIKENIMQLRIVTRYEAKDWIFMDKAQYIIDGKMYSYSVNPHREIRSVNILEEADQRATDEQIELLRLIAKTPTKVDLRFTGSYTYDSYIPQTTKDRLQKILTIFDKLKL